jgi:hypothetical protein
MIESVSGVTLTTHNTRTLAFYRMAGLEIVHGGYDAAFAMPNGASGSFT